MAKGKQSRRRRSRLSLSVRFSVLMLLAALIPLAVVVGINDYFARQTLISQSSDALSANATSSASRVDDYLGERLLDGVALSTLDTAPKFLTCVPQEAAAKQALAQGLLPTLSSDCAANFDSYAQSVGRALAVGTQRDKNYTEWDIFLPNGQFLLSSNPQTQKAGVTIPKEDLSPVQQGRQWISGVYYNAQQQYAFVHLYTPLFANPISPNKGAVLGVLAATLKLNKVWSIVDQATVANGAGSIAFITDANGVRIADTNRADLFTAVQPLDAQAQGLIASEQRYGVSSQVQVQSVPAVASALTESGSQMSFQTTLSGGKQFAFVGEKLSNMSWVYFVASPISTITAVATQQLKLSLISAAVVAVLAALLGLLIGSRTASPVEGSVSDLEGAVTILKSLASRQENSASEQHWVVDACKTGLDGVRYLADAMNQAAKRIITASNWFNDYWDRLTEEQARATVQHLRELAAYIDEAARRQQASSDRLDKAITVTMQVSDQLLTGATEATQSAAQLEQVVRDLQHVVGGRFSASADASDNVEQMRQRIESVTGAVPAIPAPNAANSRMLPPARPASPSARLAPHAPRQAWDSPSQMGGDDWEALSGPMGQGQMGQSGPIGSPSGGYGMGARGNGARSQMGQMGQGDPQW